VISAIDRTFRSQVRNGLALSLMLCPDSCAPAPDRHRALGFASGALLLAALGIFGVIAYRRDTADTRVRRACGLGAYSTPHRALVIRQTAWIVTTGLVLGFAAALALTRLMAGLLYNVPPTDAATLQPSQCSSNCRVTGRATSRRAAQRASIRWLR